MRFIGELHKKDLISAGTIKESCLDRLIQSPVEEELTCMCKLFQTIGAKLEHYYEEKSKLKKSKMRSHQNIFPDYFEKIQALVKNHPSSRVRFMLFDLVEMRNNNWVARREGEKMVSLGDKNTNSNSNTTTASTATAPSGSAPSITHASGVGHANSSIIHNGSVTVTNASLGTGSTTGSTAIVEPVIQEPVKPVVSEGEQWSEVT